MVTDPIADVLTRIRNAQRAGHKSVNVLNSKMSVSVLQVLKNEGFISFFEKKVSQITNHEEIEVGLKYFDSGEPFIKTIKRVSKPGRRIYMASDKLPSVDSGLGIAIVSTSDGVISDRIARQKNVGGEVLALVG